MSTKKDFLYRDMHDEYHDNDDDDDEQDYNERKNFQELDVEEAMYPLKGVDVKYKRYLYVIGAVCLSGWIAALCIFIVSGSYRHRSTLTHDPDATTTVGTGRKLTIGQLQGGQWRPRTHAISWIKGPNGEDGLLLEEGQEDRDYLVVEDVRSRINKSEEAMDAITLMESGDFTVGEEFVSPRKVWPSPDLKHVLALSHWEHNWRHSFTGRYWIIDVKSQKAEPLDPLNSHGRIQLATWSPNSDSIVFTRDNDMYLRKLDSGVRKITTSGGPDMFNGVPDWVYEEEVFGGNSATWWSRDGRHIAFLATNETSVPVYPVQYFLSRPSGKIPPPELENYPEVRQIKYPKAGAPNPVVHLRFYSVDREEVFDVPIEDDFPDLDRLITEVVWGRDGEVLIRETNRESDILKMVLIDTNKRSGKIVRTENVTELDGGWFEVSETTTFVPANVSAGREHDGYIDTVIYKGYDHLGYFSPMNSSEPKLITSGKWEVVDAPTAVDFENSFIYFTGTKEGSLQRHIYKVHIDGSELSPITDVDKDGYYDASFSSGTGFALLTYSGPGIPWQKVISTPSNPSTYSHTIEENKELAELASRYELPIKVFSTVKIDGVELNVVERRPPHFDKRKKYPVLFYLYGGPGSQTVDKRFTVDFQSYVASNLGYIVVTVDGRGTGFIGREARTIVRGNIGYYEAHDQIETAKIWSEKSYVDASRMAIWGWSYGGYMTLKTLEQDAGRTFRYGMAVAPVTDWRFYGTHVASSDDMREFLTMPPDSIYTERYLHTPQHNPGGYNNASVQNVTAMSQNVRFLLMHGVADDNVHLQNSLTLLDKLDMAGVENYDVHVFPDSDHSIYFHGANRIVYDKLSWWLINAFNGEWERLREVVPLKAGVQVGAEHRRSAARI